MEDIVICRSSPKWIADQRSADKHSSEIGDNSTTDWRLQKRRYLPTSFDVSVQLQLKINRIYLFCPVVTEKSTNPSVKFT